MNRIQLCLDRRIDPIVEISGLGIDPSFSSMRYALESYEVRALPADPSSRVF